MKEDSERKRIGTDEQSSDSGEKSMEKGPKRNAYETQGGSTCKEKNQEF